MKTTSCWSANAASGYCSIVANTRVLFAAGGRLTTIRRCTYDPALLCEQLGGHTAALWTTRAVLAAERRQRVYARANPRWWFDAEAAEFTRAVTRIQLVCEPAALDLPNTRYAPVNEL